MSSEPYSTSSLFWQLGQARRRFTEWAEYQFAQADIDFPELPDWSLPLIAGRVLFWILVVALAAWLGLLLYRALKPSIQEWLGREQQWVTLGSAEQNIGLEQSAQYWRQQALALARQGSYGEACNALYQATLQQLHDRQMLRHDPSRTDSEYLSDLSRALEKPVPRPYQLLIGTHERLTYGTAIATAEMFKRCHLAYEKLHEQKRG
ncbi:MAG: DUF4129 domain-containing protein [Cyanobacteria bacterium P01_D01_bin.1]